MWEHDWAESEKKLYLKLKNNYIMELEEMKNLWEEMSIGIEKQKRITDSLIVKMTHISYRNKIIKILVPEIIGTFVCFAGAVFILIHFQKLGVWYLLVCGIISVLILFLLPVLSIKSIRKIRSIISQKTITSNPYWNIQKPKYNLCFFKNLAFTLVPC